MRTTYSMRTPLSDELPGASDGSQQSLQVQRSSLLPDAQPAATAVLEQTQAWDRSARHAEPSLGYKPDISDRSQIPFRAVAIDKTHGVVTISWPQSS